MGNCASATPAGRLVFPDGKVELFTTPMQVAQTMIRHPQYYIGPPEVQKSARAILAGDDILKPGNVYYFVPAYLIPPEMFVWQRNYSTVQRVKRKSSSTASNWKNIAIIQKRPRDSTCVRTVLLTYQLNRLKGTFQPFKRAKEPKQ